ncbi:MAG: spore coat protein [Oscillospiraceae bacterium]|nr:spore coat protein [Oscillospiraceae bacterium]MDD3833556.1 spore coat protein [Oscillospiraceae bacterium]MDD4546592.1 spore coat protein [Oscillospiraceae bacterium]
MLQDKVMINDALSMVKSSLTFYANAISECANLELRSTYQQIRNNCETTQYDLFKLAETKGFYKPASMANDNEIQQVKSELQQG